MQLIYPFFIHLIKWALVGLWWAYPRDIYGTSSTEVLIFVPKNTPRYFLQMKKKSCLFIHYPKASTKQSSEFSCSRLIGFNFWLDFFGRLPLIKCCFIIGFSLAIFQKNEHSLVAIEHTIYFPLVMICAKKRAKK